MIKKISVVVIFYIGLTACLSLDQKAISIWEIEDFEGTGMCFLTVSEDGYATFDGSIADALFLSEDIRLVFTTETFIIYQNEVPLLKGVFLSQQENILLTTLNDRLEFKLINIHGSKVIAQCSPCGI